MMSLFTRLPGAELRSKALALPGASQRLQRSQSCVDRVSGQVDSAASVDYSPCLRGEHTRAHFIPSRVILLLFICRLNMGDAFHLIRDFTLTIQSIRYRTLLSVGSP